MNRVIRISMLFTVMLTLGVGTVLAQTGQRGMLERKMWYVDGDGKIAEALYWRIFLGDYDVKVTRNFPGKGQQTVDAGMNFQFFSTGYIEGNGACIHGKVQALPGFRVQIDGKAEEIKFEDIDYIYDYGTKIVTKDGRRGDFMMQMQPEGTILELKRFQLSEYKQFKGSFGELELKEVKNKVPIIGIAFSKEAAAKASKEPVTH